VFGVVFVSSFVFTYHYSNKITTIITQIKPVFLTVKVILFNKMRKIQLVLNPSLDPTK